ncbi:hypothetical protein E5329_14775 [Petralouisia muris]|jgi:hypothetical protein|uniref:Uncharacterized protein n=1 Tax=Petralouisia muris TaxID=3032872 RepID=A0AC61RUF8_9FIRM|nr:hypothetical protein [Petralouisia muris]TGY95428.1 hypothetical protein E5329_14775 [Petralouisia muris]
MKRQKRWLIVLAMAVVLGCAGCGMEETIIVNPDLSAQAVVNYYTTSQEEAAVAKELGEGYTYEQLMEEAGCTYLGTEERDGTVHNVYQSTQKMSRADSKDSFVVLTQDQAVLDIGGFEEIQKEILGGEDFPNSLKFLNTEDITVKVKYPFQVYKTNGILQEDGCTVFYPLNTIKNKERIYAVRTSKCAKTGTCTIKGVKNNGCYRKIKTVKASSGGVITSFRVNNESQPENEYTAVKDGVYKVKVKMLTGSTKTVKFTVDRTKPQTNIKAKTYSGKVKITFKDKTSGIKKATLNGKRIKSGKTVSRAGNYVLKISDKAGNVRTVKFSIV